jgi:hypothetical protein
LKDRPHSSGNELPGRGSAGKPQRRTGPGVIVCVRLRAAITVAIPPALRVPQLEGRKVVHAPLAGFAIQASSDGAVEGRRLEIQGGWRADGAVVRHRAASVADLFGRLIAAVYQFAGKPHPGGGGEIRMAGAGVPAWPFSACACIIVMLNS